ncbi:MAG TPA: hypothetical protein VLA77_04745 [Candidatus Saccharimonadales bacterium]|nr:hypothetical protein [Candidatus Saccharimonadales bacterium]
MIWGARSDNFLRFEVICRLTGALALPEPEIPAVAARLDLKTDFESAVDAYVMDRDLADLIHAGKYRAEDYADVVGKAVSLGRPQFGYRGMVVLDLYEGPDESDPFGIATLTAGGIHLVPRGDGFDTNNSLHVAVVLMAGRGDAVFFGDRGDSDPDHSDIAEALFRIIAACNPDNDTLRALVAHPDFGVQLSIPHLMDALKIWTIGREFGTGSLDEDEFVKTAFLARFGELAWQEEVVGASSKNRVWMSEAFSDFRVSGLDVRYPDQESGAFVDD